MKTPILGLIVNPVAGIGGRVGLNGSDGAEIQRRARELGAIPVSIPRAIQALRRLAPLNDRLTILTFPSEMGEEAAQVCGFQPVVIGSIQPGHTCPEDTQAAAQEMRHREADLILFAGGDGTARDVYKAIGDRCPVLGIPAGVKIHSAVYAVNPESAGDLALLYLQGKITTLQEAEVMDIDEAAYRRGSVSPLLYGYLRIPFQREKVQARKAPSPLGEEAALEGIARAVIQEMLPDWLYIVGPGTTTRPILAQLGLSKTLIGVDVVLNKQLIAADANEAALLGLLESHPAKIVVTPIGGQGYLFGRGNQQLSPAVLLRIGKGNIIVVSTLTKVHALNGRPFLIDTGDPQVNHMLTGYIRVVTGHQERILYRVDYPMSASNST